MPVSAESVLDALRWRYATKHFDPAKKIPDADWATLIESVRLTPSSFGLQPWKFYVVLDPAKKNELVAASWNQAQVRDCSHLLVLTAKRRLEMPDVDGFVDDMVATRGTPREQLKGMRDMILGFAEANPEKLAWATNQVYIALGFLMQTAALMGIDACPMEGIDKAAYDKAVGVDEKYATVVACPLGYRAETDRHAKLAKVRFAADKLFVTV